MVERNEVKQDSFESKLYETIEYLVKERKERLDSSPTDDEITLGKTTFTNEAIRNWLKHITDGEDIPDKKDCFYSNLEGVGFVSQKKITSILKSKFKVEPRSVALSDKTHRCIEFNEKYLNRIKSNYDTPNEIKYYTITDITLSRGEVLRNYADLINTKIQGINALENHNVIGHSPQNCNKCNSVMEEVLV